MALAWGITRKRVVAYRVAGAGSLIVAPASSCGRS